MIDLKRYGGLIGAGLCLALALGSIDRVLSATLGERPPWLEDQNAVDWKYYELFGSRVAAVEYERERSPERAPGRYGLLIGASTIQRGPLPDLVQSRTHMPWLLLGVGGGAGAFSKIRKSIGVLRDARLTPAVIVLGVHPLWLSSQRDVARAIPPAHRPWIERQSRLISNFVYARLEALRMRLLLRKGGGTWAVFPPAKDPWNPPPEAPYVDPLPEHERAEHLEKNQEAGRFDPASYVRDSEPVREMILTVEELAAIQPNLLVVLMPEHSDLRKRVPEAASILLREALAEMPRHPPRIVDLRDAISDGPFFDNYHLTMRGRRELSNRLAEEYLSEYADDRGRPR